MMIAICKYRFPEAAWVEADMRGWYCPSGSMPSSRGTALTTTWIRELVDAGVLIFYGVGLLDLPRGVDSGSASGVTAWIPIPMRCTRPLTTSFNRWAHSMI